MPQYMLLLHEDPAGFANVTPSEMQTIIEKYTAWAGKLAQEGRLVGSHKLRDGSGKSLRRNAAGKITVTDGPYTEGKEIIGGYFTVQAGDYDEASSIASECPHVEFGVVEIREIEVIPGE